VLLLNQLLKLLFYTLKLSKAQQSKYQTRTHFQKYFGYKRLSLVFKEK